MSRLTTDILFQVADHRVFGRALAHLELVDEIREEGDQVYGTLIHEGVTYRARVSDEEEFTWNCDCAEGRGQTPCFHAVVTGIAFAVDWHLRPWPPRPPKSPLDVSPFPFDHDGLMRRLRTGEQEPDEPPLAVALAREVSNGRCHDLGLLFHEALDVFLLPAAEQRPAYLRALAGAREAIGQFYVNGQRDNGEELYDSVLAYVERTEDMIEDPDGAVATAVRMVVGIPDEVPGEDDGI
ncbi:hypothetical protein [Nocardiopsis salina]|uniref:hypothetical protein n=1 Tax=Nocardiopsis salina TaxID=245836 RepID=UPI00034532B4|nr:hypothetical protein [Nocardiopsis salina]